MIGDPLMPSQGIKVYACVRDERVERVCECYGAELQADLPPVERQVWAAADTQRLGAIIYYAVEWDYDDVLVVGPDHKIVPVPQGARRVNIPTRKSLHADQALAILLNEYSNERN